ncbi:MAG: FHA domain-containing protein [Pseudomonadota bacterium]
MPIGSRHVIAVLRDKRASNQSLKARFDLARRLARGVRRRLAPEEVGTLAFVVAICMAASLVLTPAAQAANSAEEDLLTNPDAASTPAASESAPVEPGAPLSSPSPQSAPEASPDGPPLSVVVVAAGACLVAILAITLLVAWLRRRRGGADAPGKRPVALLKDLMNVTGTPEIAITEDAVIIGRLSTNSGQGVQGVTLPINTVGRRHAQIEYRQHAFYVSDLQSRNGTLVNGNRIEGSTILHNGDVIHIEGVQFVFVLPDESLGDETQLVGSRDAPPAAVGITVAPGFEAPVAAPAGGGSLIEMYGGDASDTGGVLEDEVSSASTEIIAPPRREAVTEQPAMDKTVALGAPVVDGTDEAPEAALTEAFEAVTESPAAPAADPGFPGLLAEDESGDDETDVDSAPTAAQVSPAGGLIDRYGGGDESVDPAPSTGAERAGSRLIDQYRGTDEEPEDAQAPSSEPVGGSLIAQYGGTDDEPDEAAAQTMAADTGGLIAGYSDPADSAPESAPTTAPPPPDAPPAEGGLIAQFGGVDEEPLPAGSGIEGRYADTADEEMFGSDSPTSMLDGLEEGGGFELLLDESDTRENLPVAAAYAETGDMEPDTQEPPMADEERTADVLRNAAQSVPGMVPVPDLEDTGASPRIDRAYLEAQGLISNGNLPPAVPSPRPAPPPSDPPPPMRPERAMPEPPSSGGQGAPLPLAFLIDRDGGASVPQYQIETDNLFVGRSVPTQVQARSYFSIPSKTIGRKHASIRYARGRFWVEDHKSINGTYVNGERVIGMAPLESGDEICFDTFRFGFLVMADGGADSADDADKTVFSGGR